ncbi:hypothetical protein [Actinoplanes sp. NBRC 103695]|uniref:hypothetical protein n=1 Tax=Actinoplanes sp. NBRC 103695 TaxID=3032202 RepID=UPI0025567985|nr:hypothetical protein [Actinoplanes sp. NBRC 103695]
MLFAAPFPGHDDDSQHPDDLVSGASSAGLPGCSTASSLRRSLVHAMVDLLLVQARLDIEEVRPSGRTITG